MFSIFPPLLSFQGFAPFFLRIAIGMVFIYWAYSKFNKEKVRSIGQKSLGILEGLIGISLIIGFLTQLSALIASVILIVSLSKKIVNKSFLTDGINYYLILLSISLSLIFLGSGIFAFDLPL